MHGISEFCVTRYCFQEEPYEGLDDFTAGSKVVYQELRLLLPSNKECPVLHEIMKK